MSNPRIGPAVPVLPPSAPRAAEPRSPTGSSPFGELVTAARQPVAPSSRPAAPTLPPAPAAAPASNPPAAVAPTAAAPPVHPASAPPGLTELGRALLARVARGERYVENVVRQGLHGRAFTNDELLVMQAQVYRYTQELDLLSRFVERATSTVKTVMQQSG